MLATTDIPSEHATSPGWLLDVVSETSSTNQLAARMPAWHAVRAEVQTAGRGRTGRHWVSDPGGLWLSAVLPCPGPRTEWALLPLAAGHAVCRCLAGLGVSDLRLRWPNDILCGREKLAGLLVERHTADTAVVGIGINVHNHPERDATLRTPAARLAELLPPGASDLSLDDLAGLVLRALSDAHAALARGDFPRIAAELNASWGPPRLVALDLAGEAAPATGLFTGIDECGRLRLLAPDGRTTAHDPVQVAMLRELEG